MGHRTDLANIVRTPEASFKSSQVLQNSNAKSLRPVTYPFNWHQMPPEIKQSLKDNEMKWLDLQM